ncbi:rhomboid family intramembrane serine protease [Clostridium sp.]|uniref:rhomboid family intramembrane serine protease n=1 Tax=Clostridium sp. TaxID=1506 RepID=UPI0026372A95|nr:rhomboid family intramembrane serine protease [Clostridium sp.]
MRNFKENFEKDIFGVLTKELKFYMKYYFSHSYKENKWISILDLEGYYLCVIVTDSINEAIDYVEAMEYLKENLNKGIILNSIVLDKENIVGVGSDKIVISSENKDVTYCGENAKGLLNVVNYVLKKQKANKKKFDFKRYKITYTLIFINILIYTIEVILSGNAFDIDVYTLLFMGAKYNPLIESGEIYRLITSSFLHGGIIHLFFNMSSLKIMGEEVELIYGKIKYISIYIISALGGGIFSFIFNDRSVSVGASGAIFGLLGAMLLFGLLNKEKIGKGYTRSIVQTIGINIILGFTIPVIDNSAHIGGLMFGIIISFIIFKIYGFNNKI